MSPEDRDRFMARLLALWPTPTMSDATRVVWNEFIVNLSGPRSMRALDSLQRSSRHRPAQSDFWGSYCSEPSDNRLARPECFVCEDGWVQVPCGRPGCKATYCTVTRCPNGCMPPTPDELHQRRLEEERQWDIDNARKRESA